MIAPASVCEGSKKKRLKLTGSAGTWLDRLRLARKTKVFLRPNQAASAGSEPHQEGQTKQSKLTADCAFPDIHAKFRLPPKYQDPTRQTYYSVGSLGDHQDGQMAHGSADTWIDRLRLTRKRNVPLRHNQTASSSSEPQPDQASALRKPRGRPGKIYLTPVEVKWIQDNSAKDADGFTDDSIEASMRLLARGIRERSLRWEIDKVDTVMNVLRHMKTTQQARAERIGKLTGAD